jgi:ferrous iron transport protein A
MHSTLPSAPGAALDSHENLADITHLDNLPPGLAATVCHLHGSIELTARLRALGIKPGRRVQVIRRAPLSGPLQVRAGQTDIILRRHEAAGIHVNPLI